MRGRFTRRSLACIIPFTRIGVQLRENIAALRPLCMFCNMNANFQVHFIAHVCIVFTSQRCGFSMLIKAVHILNDVILFVDDMRCGTGFSGQLNCEQRYDNGGQFYVK